MNWGTGLRKQRARADQGSKSARELIIKFKEFQEFSADNFLTIEGNSFLIN